MGVSCFYSNYVEELYEELCKKLFCSSTNFFTKRVLVVPSLAMKRWLSLKMARDTRVKSAFNIEFLYLSRTLPFKPISKLELALRIESELLKIQGQSLFEDFFAYLKLDEGLSRLTKLSHETAALFLHYRESAAVMIDEWIQNPLSSWQAYLFTKIFADQNPYKEVLKKASFESQDKQVHLFALSFIPKIYLSYFKAASCQTYIWALSPTAHFWTDLKTRSEADWIYHFLKEKNIKESLREELLEYLLNTNPLLADFGKVGRKFFLSLEEMDFEVKESYCVEEGLALIYEELIPCDIKLLPNHSFSLLKALQMDLLFMRELSAKLKPFIPADDRSIEIHASLSKLREIEVLYEMLVEKLTLNQILEEEVLVMAPNMASYAPFIETVFGRKSSLLEYQILDLKVSSQSDEAKGFELFLNLIHSRFSFKDIKKLFENDSFAKKMDIVEEEIEEMDHFFQYASITWGFDENHRQKIFKKEYGDTPFQKNGGNTWKDGFENLIKTMVSLEEDHYPIEFSNADLIGKFIEIIQSLIQDIKLLESDQKRFLKEWTQVLTEMVDKYFFGNKEWIYTLLNSFAKVPLEEYFSFESLHAYLIEKLGEESSISYDNKVSAVRFCSLLPMRAIPAKVVCLLGLDELSFPRHAEVHPLDMRANRKDVDFVPTSGQYDRYLFLESILSARNSLILSFSKNPLSHEMAPCELIKEIISYIEEAHDIKLLIQEHPLDPFDASYFERPHYNQTYFECAKIYYQDSKSAPFAPIANFMIKHAPQNPSHLTINLQELTSLIAKPLKFYVSKFLYLNSDEDKEKEELLLLNPLHLYQIKRAALRYPLDRILKVMEKRALVPKGIFESMAKDKVRDLVIDIQKNIKEMGITGKDLKTFFIEDNCRKKAQFSKMEIYPKIDMEMDGSLISFCGKIEHVVSSGMLTIRNSSFEDLIKELPSYLVLSLLKGFETPLSIYAALDGKVKTIKQPQKALKTLVNYYLLCKDNPSPLLPKSLKKLLEGEFKIKEDEYDPYLALINKDHIELDDQWFTLAKELFDEVHKDWYAK